MILRVAATGRVVALDFRERAPAASTRDMFAPVTLSVPEGHRPSEVGGLAVGVPGLLAGQMDLLHRWGRIRVAGDGPPDQQPPALAVILAPAIRLAEAGFPVDQHYVDACHDVHEKFKTDPTLKQRAGYVWRTHLRSGRLPAVGDALVQPRLAETLERIAEQGAGVFYRGEIATALVETVRQAGGIMTREDLRNYTPNPREAIRTTYRGHEIIGFPPPSSGGIAVAEALNILETVDLRAIGAAERAKAAHWIVEALKHAFADRARWLGDPEFVDVPMRQLVEKGYGERLARNINPDGVAEIDYYGSRRRDATAPPTAAGTDDAGTSHFCVVDRGGNCVVWTETINTSFGSLLAVDDYGIILNNEMDDFAAEPDKPNAYGLVQSAYNAVAPGKRPLSSMSPTIVLRNGSPMLLVGGSGGPRIISAVLQTIVNVVDFQMPIESAVRALRVHHQWRPETLHFDRDPAADLVDGLALRGHSLSELRRSAVVQAIHIGTDGITGVSDPRKGGRPAGL
jgi:gamma-glutamyltranspeptidase/glutathione hydrolase